MTSGSEVELLVTDDAARLAAEQLAAAVVRGGNLALAGGSSPRPAYELAAALEPDWSRVVVWLGDERCVPADDERANVRLVREALAAARVPGLRAVDTSLPPDGAAADYDEKLEGVTLELAFLGLGPDGHTASLFPAAPSLAEATRRAVAVPAGLEPWVERVTMTIPFLCASRTVVYLVTGEAKADAARRAFAEPPSPATPASLVRSSAGRTIAILDRAAARAIPRSRVRPIR